MKGRLASVSPLMLAAASTLLTFIIGVFALSNYSREKELMTEALLQKGLGVMRFLDTGVRVSMRASWQSRQDAGAEWREHLQGVIDQLHEDTDIHFVEITNTEGIILAGSVLDRVGRAVTPETFTFIQSARGDDPITRVHADIDTGRNGYQVARIFKPRVRGTMLQNNQRGRNMMEGMRRKQPGYERLQKDLELLEKEGMSILVQLDMAQYNSAVRSQLWQIVILSVVLLLVGSGGWISLMTLQGFRGTESRLKRIRAFNDMLVESLPVGLVATDDKGTIQVVNSSAEIIVGVAAKKLIGKQPHMVLPVELARPFTDREKDVEVPDFIECELSSEKGSVRSLFMTMVAVTDDENMFTGAVLLIQDVSNIRKLEKELRRSERLAALGRMAAGVAHELRNPLSSIKGLAVLLKNKVIDDREGVQTAEVLVGEVERLNRSISELLDYARPETLQLNIVSLQKILEKAIALVTIDAEALNIAVDKEYDMKKDLVLVDEDKMNQVFLNLMLNAIQAMADGGTLTLRTECEDGWVCSTIEDTGSGVAEEHLARVFDPYFTTKNNGTGLGLALSAKIVEEHGGYISLKSNQGLGASAVVKLPLSGVR